MFKWLFSCRSEQTLISENVFQRCLHLIIITRKHYILNICTVTGLFPFPELDSSDKKNKYEDEHVLVEIVSGGD